MDFANVSTQRGRHAHKHTHMQLYKIKKLTATITTAGLASLDDSAYVCVCVFGLCPGLKHSSGPPLTERLLEVDDRLPAAVGCLASGYRQCARVRVQVCVCVWKECV